MIKKTGGFTLIELMIVLAVLSIIVAIGYPSYQEHVKKSRRAEGMGQLLELADRMERA
jgi:type IV pilus assembly protein PilE